MAIHYCKSRSRQNEVWTRLTLSFLSKCGFINKRGSLDVVQLGGLHSNAYISDLFAQNYAKEGMKAYVELIQRRERELGTDVLTHQKVSRFPLD